MELDAVVEVAADLGHDGVGRNVGEALAGDGDCALEAGLVERLNAAVLELDVEAGLGLGWRGLLVAAALL